MCILLGPENWDPDKKVTQIRRRPTYDKYNNKGIFECIIFKKALTYDNKFKLSYALHAISSHASLSHA